MKEIIEGRSDLRWLMRRKMTWTTVESWGIYVSLRYKGFETLCNVITVLNTAKHWGLKIKVDIVL